MVKYLIKTMKIRDDAKSDDWTEESNWMYIDPETIHIINIFGKKYTDESEKVAGLVRCKDCKWLWRHLEGDTHKVNLSMYRCLKYHNPDTENFYCGDGERRDEVKNG